MKRHAFDICIYGGVSGGVVAAVAASRLGRSVVIVEPTRHLGGMTTGGLGWTDFGKKDSIGGLARRFYDEIAAHYTEAGCPESDHGQGLGWSHEPHVAENIFNAWVLESGVQVFFEHRISKVLKSGSLLRSIVLDFAPPDQRGAPLAEALEPASLQIDAAVFIDCTYEGDLMSLAGVSHTSTRESADTYGEAMAGVIYTHHESLSGELTTVPTPEGTFKDISPFRIPSQPDSGLLPFLDSSPIPVSGSSSAALQAYNFRLCLTDDPALMVPIEPVGEYDPLWFEIMARSIQKSTQAGDPLLPAHFCHAASRILKISPLPFRKSDVNNSGSISSDFIGQNYAYPNGDWPTRSRIWHAHEDYQRGLHYFLRSDLRIEDSVREAAASWGLASDEFPDTGHWPHQLYVRESRRMLGSYVIMQSDCEGKRAVEDSIGRGSYSLDSHGCRRFAWNGGVLNEGGFMHRIRASYPISWQGLLPRPEECDNLAVLFCLSASHAAYSSVRMEPVLMILGESAGIAACQILDEGSSLQRVNFEKLRTSLLNAGQVL